MRAGGRAWVRACVCVRACVRACVCHQLEFEWVFSISAFHTEQ